MIKLGMYLIFLLCFFLSLFGTHFASLEVEDVNRICPGGGGTTCPESSTCCPTKRGGFGCCGLTNAECCADKEHCCPQGYECQGDRCYLVARNSSVGLIGEEDVVCPGGKTTCPGSTTCCQISPGNFACCPLPEAVCCADGLHCCPKGTVCDLSVGTCNKVGGELTPKTELSKSHSFKKVKATDITCGSGEDVCPDGNTCCKTPNGKWGCCPMPNAVCCDDHIHCCPENTKCSQGGCQTLTEPTPYVQLKHLASKIPKFRDVVCPGEEYQCPDDNTCCKLESGEWGCCPMPNASCCADLVHCCPEGTTCQTGSCTTPTSSVPWQTKFEATPVPRL